MGLVLYGNSIPGRLTTFTKDQRARLRQVLGDMLRERAEANGRTVLANAPTSVSARHEAEVAVDRPQFSMDVGPQSKTAPIGFSAPEGNRHNIGHPGGAFPARASDPGLPDRASSQHRKGDSRASYGWPVIAEAIAPLYNELSGKERAAPA